MTRLTPKMIEHILGINDCADDVFETLIRITELTQEGTSLRMKLTVDGTPASTSFPLTEEEFAIGDDIYGERSEAFIEDVIGDIEDMFGYGAREQVT